MTISLQVLVIDSKPVFGDVGDAQELGVLRNFDVRQCDDGLLRLIPARL